MKVFIVTLALVAAVCGMPNQMLRPTFDHSGLTRPTPDFSANMHDIIRPAPQGVASIPADSPLVQIIINVQSDKTSNNAVETIHVPVGTFPLSPIEIPEHIQTLPIMPIETPSVGTFPMIPVEDLTRPIFVDTGSLLRPTIESPSVGTFPMTPIEDLTRPIFVDTGSLLRPTIESPSVGTFPMTPIEDLTRPIFVDTGSLLRPTIESPSVGTFPMTPIEDLTRPIFVETGSLLRPTIEGDASSLLRPIVQQPIAVPWPLPMSERPATSLIRKH